MPAKEPLLKLNEPEIGMKLEIGWLEKEEVGLEVVDRKLVYFTTVIVGLN